MTSGTKKLGLQILLLVAALGLLITNTACGGGDGGGSQSSQQVNTSPPVFTSTAPTSASEGAVYTYTVVATDPSSTSLRYDMVSGPTGATISGNVLSWTPTPTQSRTSNSFTIRATTGGGGTATQTWSVTPTGIIRGTQKATYISQSGETVVPDDLTNKIGMSAFEALVPDGAGGFTTLPGTGLADGTFSIANVPAGNYWLKMPAAVTPSAVQTYMWTDSSTLDFGRVEAGRSDVVHATSPTTISFNVYGLEPMLDTDRILYLVANTNTHRILLPGSDPTIFNKTISSDHLSDASKGDVGYLSQLATRNVGGIQVLALARSCQHTTFTETDGALTMWPGMMAVVPQDKFFRANIKGTAFDQLRSAANPASTSEATLAYLEATPYGASHGFIGTAADLAGTEIVPAIIDDVDSEIAYGNPYPSAWTPFLRYIHLFGVSITAPGALSSRNEVPAVLLETTTLPSATSPLQPLVGPVTSPTINGVSFFQNQTGVGLTPTLAWGPPSLGTANGYQVLIYRLYTTEPGGSYDSLREFKARLTTTATSIKLPPGILTAGNSYFIYITAFSNPATDYKVAPNRKGFPYAYADVLSGVVAP